MLVVVYVLNYGGNELKMVEGRVMKFAFCILKKIASFWDLKSFSLLLQTKIMNEMENLKFVSGCTLETCYHNPPYLK